MSSALVKLAKALEGRDVVVKKAIVIGGHLRDPGDLLVRDGAMMPGVDASSLLSAIAKGAASAPVPELVEALRELMTEGTGLAAEPPAEVVGETPAEEVPVADEDDVEGDDATG